MKKNQRAFTLAELLIVIAIVAVLVAVAIPIFTTQLERARKAVDLATMRSAKAVASAEFMTTDETKATDYYYDVSSGTVIKGLENARKRWKVGTDGYGKSSGAFDKEKDGGTGTPKVGDSHGVVKVTVDTDGKMYASWELIGNVTVTSANVEQYLKKDDDETYTLEFGTGDLSYVTIQDASILTNMDKTTKAKIKSIVFGKNNLQIQNEQSPFQGGKTGIAFWKKVKQQVLGMV